MRIAVVASEGAPYVKSGGLGDVMEALPAALQRIEGNEVLLFENEWSIRLVEENNKGLELAETSMRTVYE